MSAFQPVDQIDSYQSAVAIARQAFEYVSTYRTPPVPEIYEVWYRFAEGSNVGICDLLSKRVENNSVSTSELYMLHEQQADNSLLANSHDVSFRISEALESIQGILYGQQKASADFSGTIAEASIGLHRNELAAEDIECFLAKVLKGNETLQEYMSVLDGRLSESQSEINELRIQLHESQKAIATDTLTGVGNRRYFEVMIAGALRRVTQDAVTFLFFIDVDCFKLVNDQFGHAAGDEVLNFVASKLAEKTGSCNVARFGGDEFAVVASFPDPELANELATELCSFFCSKQFVLQRSGEKIDKLTVSIGAAMLRSGDDKDSWIERTDKFLYAAKNSGRNRPRSNARLSKWAVTQCRVNLL